MPPEFSVTSGPRPYAAVVGLTDEIAAGLVLHLDPDALGAEGSTFTGSTAARVVGPHFFLCVDVDEAHAPERGVRSPASNVPVASCEDPPADRSRWFTRGQVGLVVSRDIPDRCLARHP